MFSGHYPQKDNFGFFEAQLKELGIEPFPFGNQI